MGCFQSLAGARAVIVFNETAHAAWWIGVVTALLNVIAGAGIAILGAHLADARTTTRERARRAEVTQARTKCALLTVIVIGKAAQANRDSAPTLRSVGEAVHRSLLRAAERFQESLDDVILVYGEDLGLELHRFFDATTISASAALAAERTIFEQAGRVPVAEEQALLHAMYTTMIDAGGLAEGLMLRIRPPGVTAAGSSEQRR